MTLVEVGSFGTTNSGRQLADGLRVRLSRDCTSLELKGQVAPPETSWFWMVLTRPVTAVASTTSVVIEGGTIVGNFVTSTQDGLDASTRERLLNQPRARAILRFGLAQDSAKVAAAISRWSKGCGAPPEVAARQASIVIGADVDVSVEINGTRVDALRAGTQRAYQVASGAVRLVVRTNQGNVEESRTLQLAAGQQAVVPFLMTEKIAAAERERAARAEVEARLGARNAFEAALRAGPIGRTARLRSTFRSLDSRELATDDDRRRFDQALREQVMVTVDIGTIDDRGVGTFVTSGRGLVLKRVGKADLNESFDPTERVNEAALELPVGTHEFEIELDMEFRRADFVDAPCRGTTTIYPSTTRLRFHLRLYRGGEVECDLR
jgi:hypothetical protein